MRLLTNGFLSRLTRTGLIAHRAETQTGKSSQLDWLPRVSSLETEELLNEFNTSHDGLSAEKVELSRAAWGSNEVAHAHRDPVPVRFAKAFVDPFTGILALLAVVSLVTDVILAAPAERDPSTFIIIFAMIAVSGTLRFVQEGKSDDAAAALAKTIAMFPERVEAALADYEPSVITRYILDLAAAFNRFYHECKILNCEDEITRESRVALTAATNRVLGTALHLICLATPEQI